MDATGADSLRLLPTRLLTAPSLLTLLLVTLPARPLRLLPMSSLAALLQLLAGLPSLAAVRDLLKVRSPSTTSACGQAASCAW
jgi:hypothetical protein